MLVKLFWTRTAVTSYPIYRNAFWSLASNHGYEPVNWMAKTKYLINPRSNYEKKSNSIFVCKKKKGFVENNKEKAFKSLSFIKDLGLPLCRT